MNPSVSLRDKISVLLSVDLKSVKLEDNVGDAFNMRSVATSSLFLTVILMWFSVGVADVPVDAKSKNISAGKYNDQSIFQILQVAKILPLKLSQTIENQISKSTDDHAIIFFASWCGVCREEMTAFQQKVKSGKCSRISFISVDENKAELEKYLLKIPKVDANIYWDQNLLLSKTFKVEVLPTIVYLDRNKIVKRVQSGGKKSSNLMTMMVASAEGRQGHCE